MQIDKSQIMDLLKSRGNDEKAEQAAQELPDTVDTERDSGLLGKFGIDVRELTSNLPGGLRDKLGGLGL
jgi:hypothetical protein